MKKLPRVTAREVESALRRAGFKFSHSRGSHRSYIKEGKRVVVPFHGNRIIPPGTLKEHIEASRTFTRRFRKIIVDIMN